MGLSDKDIVALSGGHTLVIIPSCLHLYMVFFGIWQTCLLSVIFCGNREGHILRDLVLMVLGLRNLCSSITHTLCKTWTWVWLWTCICTHYALCISVYGYELSFVFIVDTRELLNGESEGLLKLPTDAALVEDPEFRKYVDLYAKVIWVWACSVLFCYEKMFGEFITTCLY